MIPSSPLQGLSKIGFQFFFCEEKEKDLKMVALPRFVLKVWCCFQKKWVYCQCSRSLLSYPHFQHLFMSGSWGFSTTKTDDRFNDRFRETYWLWQQSRIDTIISENRHFFFNPSKCSLEKRILKMVRDINLLKLYLVVLNWRVLVTTWKKSVWSTRICRKIPI
jgi:hypothetical protein